MKRKTSKNYLTKIFGEYYIKTASNIRSPTSIAKREFGFLLFQENIMIRHRKFRQKKDLCDFLKSKKPSNVYYSAAYYKKPEETAEAIRDGWFYTGDIGYMDDEGYLFIVDRKKDMIIAGGYNIYPRDIDEVLFEHPKIQEACAVGIPDAYRGETVKAFVVVKPGASLTEEEVIAHCKEKLTGYKVPKLEHQIISLRHIQHHAAQLADRLRATADVGIDWIGARRNR